MTPKDNHAEILKLTRVVQELLDVQQSQSELLKKAHEQLELESQTTRKLAKTALAVSMIAIGTMARSSSTANKGLLMLGLPGVQRGSCQDIEAVAKAVCERVSQIIS